MPGTDLLVSPRRFVVKLEMNDKEYADFMRVLHSTFEGGPVSDDQSKLAMCVHDSLRQQEAFKNVVLG